MLSEKFSKILKPETESEIQRAQIFKAILLGTALLGGGYLFSATFWVDESAQKQASDDKTKPTSIESATGQVDLNEVWRHKIEDQTNTLRNQLGEVLEMVQEKAQAPVSDNSEHLAQIQQLENRILELEVEKENRSHVISASENGNPGDPFGGAPMGPEGSETAIQKFTISLSQNAKNKSHKTVETAIPAGSFAKTVLLSGLDASASMNASSDPRPMLLRIVDPGTLPRRFKSDLKDCHCTASAFGDLSSERIYARLEKLSCVEIQTGNVIETQVAGYIAGSDGKAGIRGVVASKDGQFLGRSLVGGVFAGLSNVANPQNRQNQVNPFFAGNPQISAPNFGDMFTSGMATGATTALDRLSQYYIDRAEQLQPVIQVAAGQVVDIVFTEGATIGSQEVKEKIETTRAQNDREIETTKLPQTPPMLKGGQS